MTWYDKDWNRRAAILVDNHAGSSQIDIDAALPSDWPNFWDNVQTNGEDVRVTDGAGTALTYQLVSFNSTTKVGNVQVDDYSAPSSTAGVVVWIYWDNANAADAQGSFTASTPKSGYVALGQPGSGSEYVINGLPEAAGVDNSRTILSKHPDEVIHVWWNLTPSLLKRRVQNEESLLLEEVDTATYSVLNDQDVAQAGMIDTTSVRALHPGWVRTTIQAGADDTNYVAKLTVKTTELRTLTFHATVKVRTIHAPT
jgi:hypothetical protein